MTKEETKNDKVLNGYDILDLPGCPITLPKARSMTQARMDYEHLLPEIYRWYENVYLKNDNKQQTI